MMWLLRFSFFNRKRQRQMDPSHLIPKKHQPPFFSSPFFQTNTWHFLPPFPFLIPLLPSQLLPVLLSSILLHPVQLLTTPPFLPEHSYSPHSPPSHNPSRIPKIQRATPDHCHDLVFDLLHLVFSTPLFWNYKISRHDCIICRFTSAEECYILMIITAT